MPSKIVEMVEEEAARAEAEEPEEEEGAGELPELPTVPDDAGAAEEEEQAAEEEEPAEPEEQEARSSTAALAEFEAEVVRHAEELERITGDDWQAFQPCPHCNAIGFSPLPIEEPRELVVDASVIRCPDCDGWGKKATPSRVEDVKEQTCLTCSGRGIVNAPIQPAYTPPPPAPFPTPPLPPTWDAIANVWRDQFGNALNTPQPFAAGTPAVA